MSYQVVSEKLHDEGRVFVAFLAQGVELYSGISKTHKIQLSYIPAMASSKASLARWQAWSGELRIS